MPGDVEILVVEAFSAGLSPSVLGSLSPAEAVAIREEGNAMARALSRAIDACAGFHGKVFEGDVLEGEVFEGEVPSAINGGVPQVGSEPVARWIDKLCQAIREQSPFDDLWWIAPETPQVLPVLLTRAADIGWNPKRFHCSPGWIRWAADKLQVAQWAADRQIPHPATQLADREPIAPMAKATDCVWLKPRWGAGGVNSWRVSSESELTSISAGVAVAGFIVQQHIEGRSVSATGLFQRNGEVLWNPPGLHRMRYEGTGSAGQMTCEAITPLAASDKAAADLVIQAAERLAGWIVADFPGEAIGWIGFDFLLDRQGQAWLVDINPRLTSTITYFEAYPLVSENLMAFLRSQTVS